MSNINFLSKPVACAMTRCPTKRQSCTNDQGLQKSGLYTLSDVLSGEPGYRFIRRESSGAETYRIACIGWVHRSAYDNVLGDHSEHTRVWRVPVYGTRLLRRLLDAHSWLAHYFPGQRMDPLYSPVTRIVNVIKGRTGEIRLAGFQTLDELRHTIETAHSERRCVGTDGAPVIDSTLLGVFDEAKSLRAFWISLIHRSQGGYLIARFEKIKSSAYADVLYSGLINYFWFWHDLNALEGECTVPAMTLCFCRLFHQGPMDSAIIAAPPVD